MSGLIKTVNAGRRRVQRRALRTLRRDKQRLVERVKTLESERDEAIAAEQQLRSAVRRLTDSGSSRYVRVLQAIDDHPDVDAMTITDDQVIDLLRAIVSESALRRGWEACETGSGGLEWRRFDDSGAIVRMMQHPITPAGGVVVAEVLAGVATG